MITLQITEHQVAEDDFETIIVEETETGTIVRTIATVHVQEYAEQFLDNAALRARVGELERERDEYKRLTGGKTLQEFDEWLNRILKNEEEFAKQSSENIAKLQSISASLAKGAK